MDLVNDIINNHIKCSCFQCKNKFKCADSGKGICGSMDINNKQYLLDEALAEIKSNLPKTQRTKMNYAFSRSKYTYDDNVTTLYKYYVAFINDILRNIRRGETDYVFNLEQVKDILRYERDIDVTYQDDFCYEIKKY